jgi:type VI secretion system protein ImpG
MTFVRAYREELAFLRETGRALAGQSPGLCDALARPGTDPDVERLLEGFALLAARTRLRADDAIPEAIEAIAEVVAPQALVPLPASTIVELTPRPGVVRERLVVPRGAAFGARPIDGVACELRATDDVEVSPLAIERAAIERDRPDAPALVVAISAPRACEAALYSERPLRFFVHAPLAEASGLVHALDRHLEAVVLRTEHGEHVLGKTVRVRSSEREHLPWPARAPAGGRPLAEIAACPEAGLFFEIGGLERVPASLRAPRVELRVVLRRPLGLAARLAEGALRLHCVPAVNVFPCDAEPIAWDDDLADVPLRAAGLPPHASEVFDVLGVEGLPHASRQRTRYAPVHAFAHLDAARADGAFALRRARSPLDGAVDTYLRVARGARGGRETLSTTLQCTNRRLAARLRAGDVCVPIAGSPAVASFTNLTALSPSRSAPVGEELLARLVGAASVGHRARLDARAVRALLALHAVDTDVDAGRGRACEAMSEAIREVSSRPTLAARRGVIERGVDVMVEVDEARVPSLGEAFAWMRALDRALAAELPLNVSQRLVVVLAPSGARVELPPRTGLGALA